MATRGMLMSLSCFFLKSKCTLCKKEKGIMLCFIDSNVLFPCFPLVWTGKEPMLFGIHSLLERQDPEMNKNKDYGVRLSLNPSSVSSNWMILGMS